MAGATNANPNSMKLEHALEPDSLTGKNKEYWYGQIFDRTRMREAELEEDEKDLFLKFMKALEQAFEKQFDHKGLLGAYIKEETDGRRFYHYDDYDLIDKKAPLLDVLYTTYSHLKPSQIGEGENKKNVFTGNSGNGHIVATRNKIEFVPGHELKKDGTPGKQKPFGLEDAYDLVLIAVHDRSMMPPNKMKFTGTAQEKAMLYHAAKQINTLMPEGSKIDLTDMRTPKRAFVFPYNFSKKDTVFTDLIADIKDNKAKVGTILKAQKDDTEKQDQEKDQKPQQAQKPETTTETAQKRQDNNDTPPDNAPPPNNDGGPDSSGNNDNSADQDEDVPDLGASYGEQNGFGQESHPSVRPAATLDATFEHGAVHDPMTMEHTDDALKISDKEGFNSLDAEHGFVATEAPTSTVDDTSPEIINPTLTEEENTAAQETILSAVTETGQTLTDEQHVARAAEEYEIQAQKMVEHVGKLIGRIEKTVAGQPALDAITGILESYEDEHNLSRNPAYVHKMIEVLERNHLVVRNPNTNEALFRGVATFKDHNLHVLEQADYDVISQTIMAEPASFMSKDETFLAVSIKQAIESDSLFETKGYGYKLSPLAREDFANGMAKRMMGYLKEDNVVQLDSEGKISFIARPTPTLTQIFRQAAQPAPEAAPAATPQPRVSEQAYKLQQVPVTPIITGSMEGFIKPAPERKIAQPQASEQEVKQEVKQEAKAEQPFAKRLKIRIPGEVTDNDAMDAIEKGLGRSRIEQDDKETIMSRLERLDAILAKGPVAAMSDDEIKQIDAILDMPDTSPLPETDHPEVTSYSEESIAERIMEDFDSTVTIPERETQQITGYNKPAEPINISELREAFMKPPTPSAPYQEGDIAKQIEDMLDEQEASNSNLERTAVGRMVDRLRDRHDAPQIAAQ